MKPEPWQQLVLDTLRELSDASFQEQVWLRREGGEISSPTEVVNQLFDDSGLIDLLGGSDIVFSERADSKLKQLSAYVGTIDFEQSVEDLLSDDRWQQVRHLASQARSEVNDALDHQ
jgi:hypothetical protein